MDGDNKILVKQREYYKTGEVEEENYFVNGKLEGKYIHYDINGSI